MARLYSARQITSVTRFTLEQLEYLRDIALVVPCRAAGTVEHHRYDDLDLLRLQQIRVGRARSLALEEIRRWLSRSECGLLPAAFYVDSPPSPRQREPSPLSRTALLRSPRRLFLQTEAKVETDGEREAFQEEASQLYAALSRLRSAGALPNGAVLSRWAVRHRFHIERWFCPCAEPEHLAFARGIARNPYLSAQIDQHGRQLTSFMLHVLEAQRLQV